MLVACVALIASGCGSEGDSATPPGGSRDAPASGDVENVDVNEAVPVSARVANAVDRRLGLLVAAYSPVSDRINFLVTAETLRSAAVASGAGVEVELERTGSVRVEIGRMRTVLETARPKVDAVRVSGGVQQQLKRRMLRAMDSRMLALDQLETALDGVANRLGDQVVDERFERWRTSWNDSLRAAREATTIMQDERARVGLQPSLEEAIR
jgi:hypothetical protein